jgi:signal transduction histidine kinase
MKTPVFKERPKRISFDSPSSSRPVLSRETEAVAPCRIALLDLLGNIVAVNDEWIAFARARGAALKRVGPGANYLEACRHAMGPSPIARKALMGIESVLKGKASSFAVNYSISLPTGMAYYRMNVTAVAYGHARVAVTHTDITDLRISKEEDFKRLRQFARRLIHAQEEERQRISREIHDDLGHRIALLSFSVRQVIKQHPKGFGASIAELNKILDGFNDFSAALRNLSHFLYPPPLQYLGIRAALKSLADEFEKTYGIRVDLVVPPEAPRLAPEVELCVFRIMQESLQNIAKHSGSARVRIVLENTPDEMRLTVSDEGRGFNRLEVAKKGGIGLLSMEERALSIGARLTVNSAPAAGTEIELSVPLQEDLSVFTLE